MIEKCTVKLLLKPPLLDIQNGPVKQIRKKFAYLPQNNIYFQILQEKINGRNRKYGNLTLKYKLQKCFL